MVTDHAVSVVSAVATVGGVLGGFLGVLLRWLLRNEHRISRLEQQVFGREESPT